MKQFFGTFIACAIFFYLCFFFGGWMIFENLTALIVIVSLVATVLITAFINRDDKIKALEERIKKLEDERKSEVSAQ